MHPPREAQASQPKRPSDSKFALTQVSGDHIAARTTPLRIDARRVPGSKMKTVEEAFVPGRRKR